MSTTPHHIRLHLTNLGGSPGPIQIGHSLLPALEACAGIQVDDIYLPDRGSLSIYERHTPGPLPRRYRRILPNALSRVLECTLLARRFDGPTPLIVLGDVPLACKGRQVLFVQTLHFATGTPAGDRLTEIKNSVARRLFRLNAGRVQMFIVQTEVVKSALEDSQPSARGKVKVISPPPPQWLLDARLHRAGRRQPRAEGLALFYPAACYPYKNHGLLAEIRGRDARQWPVHRLVLTVPADRNPNPALEWIDCVGALEPRRMLDHYASADALVFLSKLESYGLPLVEAMHVGLPVICPDLPYARVLCGDEAIYFDARSVESLREAVCELTARLQRGWWPDWSDRLGRIPASWPEVASAFAMAAVSGNGDR